MCVTEQKKPFRFHVGVFLILSRKMLVQLVWGIKKSNSLNLICDGIIYISRHTQAFR
jgi:hypothetical protein